MKTSYTAPINKACANLVTFSEQFDLWAGAAPVVPNVDVGFKGRNKVADQISDANATGFAQRTFTLAIPANTQVYCCSIYVRKTSGLANGFGLFIQFTGGTAKQSTPRLNSNSGVVSGFGGSTGDGAGGVYDAGAYWRFWCTLPNNGTNTSITFAIQPAPCPVSGDTVGSDSAAQLGSAVITGAQMERASAPSAYVSTTTTSGVHSTSVISLLQSSEPPVFVHDLITITFSNGNVLRVTDGQMDLKFGGNVFSAAQFGRWKRGVITSDASFDLSANEMELTFNDIGPESGGPVPGPLVAPGTMTLLQSVYMGLFDAAQVLVQTVYMPTYGDTTYTAIKFQGDVTSVKELDRVHAVFGVSDLLYRLLQPWPPNVFQASCRHSLFNPNCDLSVDNYRLLATLAPGSSQSLLVLTSALAGIGNDPLPYTQGYVTFATGNNTGLTYTIRAQTDPTHLQLDTPALAPVIAGQTISVVPGCNKLMATCDLKYHNLIHFGGQPYTPVPETII